MNEPASGGDTPIRTAVLLRHSHPDGTHAAAEAAERAQARLSEVEADTAVLEEIVSGLAARTV